MPRLLLRPLLILASLALVAVWMFLNREYETPLSLIFYRTEKISVVLVILFSFFLGSLFSMFLFYRSLWVQKKKEKQKNKENSKKQEKQEPELKEEASKPHELEP